jgi:hypothetical protein
MRGDDRQTPSADGARSDAPPVPFRILGFHCDNGSEFLNYRVANTLEKLLVEFAKSRAYRTTDKALVEGKNGAVVRKHVGYGFIGSEHAEAMQRFFTAHLNSYLNFHRPCGFAVLAKGSRGRLRKPSWICSSAFAFYSEQTVVASLPSLSSAGRGRGSNAAPFPLDPSLASRQFYRSGRPPPELPRLFLGSLCIGIILPFQAHFWIGKC